MKTYALHTMLLLMGLSHTALAEPSPELVYNLKGTVVKIHTVTTTGGHGSGSGFVVAENLVATNCHVLTNAIGANITAHGETYYLFLGENREGPPTISFGRYIDRFEKRDGVWAIAHRVCIIEKSGAFSDVEMTEEWLAAMRSTGPDTRDRSDISYVRPLTKDRPKVS